MIGAIFSTLAFGGALIFGYAICSNITDALRVGDVKAETEAKWLLISWTGILMAYHLWRVWP